MHYVTKPSESNPPIPYFCSTFLCSKLQKQKASASNNACYDSSPQALPRLTGAQRQKTYALLPPGITPSARVLSLDFVHNRFIFQGAAA